MIQTAVQNDTILKQLDQAVEFGTASKIEVTAKKLELSKIRLIDSISRRDSVRAKTGTQQNLTGRIQQQSNIHQREEFNIQPIELIRKDSVFEPIKLDSEVALKTEIILPEKKIEKQNPDWAVGIFIFALIIFATVRIFFNKYLTQLMLANVNYATALRLFRERTMNLMHASFRLDILFFVIFSFFIFQLGSEWGLINTRFSFLQFIILFAAVIAYFVGKRILYFAIGFLVEDIPDTQEYLFNVNVYNRILGLFLIPVSLLIAFSTFANPQIFFITGITITIIFYFLSLLRGTKILLKQHFSIFYLILYLCTLEILPLVFIYKLLLVLEEVKQI